MKSLFVTVSIVVVLSIVSFAPIARLELSARPHQVSTVKTFKLRSQVLQGSSLQVQGSSPVLQGSSIVIQGSSPNLQSTYNPQ